MGESYDREQVQQFDECRWAYVFPDSGHITLRDRGWKPESDDPRWQLLRVVSQSNWSDHRRDLEELSIQGWLARAPRDVLDALTTMTVLRAIEDARNRIFQFAGRYDGSMSRECQESFRSNYKALDQLYQALVKTQSPSPSPETEHGEA